MKSLRLSSTLIVLIALASCQSLRIDPSEVRPDAVPVSVLPVETSGIFGYQDWSGHLDGLVASTAEQVGYRIDAAATQSLRFYLSDKTFVRGYQTLHSLYAQLELLEDGQVLRQILYSEETQETLESSHKLYQVVRSCLERLKSLPPVTR